MGESIDPHHLHPRDQPLSLLLFHTWAQEATHLLLRLRGHFIIWADLRASREPRK